MGIDYNPAAMCHPIYPSIEDMGSIFPKMSIIEIHSPLANLIYGRKQRRVVQSMPIHSCLGCMMFSPIKMVRLYILLHRINVDAIRGKSIGRISMLWNHR
jgi:hypothetical protein